MSETGYALTAAISKYPTNNVIYVTLFTMDDQFDVGMPQVMLLNPELTNWRWIRDKWMQVEQLETKLNFYLTTYDRQLGEQIKDWFNGLAVMNQVTRSN